MIVENGKYYLYRHIRADKNEVFYVGYGTKRTRKLKSFGDTYSRAFDKSQRSLAWKSIVSRTKYEIEIILESNDKSFIHIKEKEFIQLYGRRDTKMGTLINFTDGGDGGQGYKHSDEHKKIVSQQSKGRKHSEEAKNKISRNTKGIKKSPEHVEKMRQNALKQKHTGRPKTVYQYSLLGVFIKEWRCAVDAANELGLKHPSNITLAARKKKPTMYGYIWDYIKT